jgi:HK97 family phage major capsid protein
MNLMITNESASRRFQMKDENARQLAAMFGVAALQIGACQNWDEKRRARALKQFTAMLPFGMRTPFHEDKPIVDASTRTALTSTEIPLPTILATEVSELIWNYGDARRVATVYPLAQGVNPLPKLKTADEFGFIGASVNLPEIKPTFETVNLDAQKAAGIIRVPEEFAEDQPELFGNYLGNYIARHLAKFEDKTMFLADGTATYKTRKGVCKTAVDNGWLVQLSAGKLAPSDITLADVRNLRKQVNPEVLAGSAYFASMSNDQLFTKFNSNVHTVYVASASPPRLDGYPVIFTGIMPLFDDQPHPGQVQIAFGDMSYWTLGIRQDVTMRISRALSNNLDELRVLPVERFDIGLLGDKAVAALQLAAA